MVKIPFVCNVYSELCYLSLRVYRKYLLKMYVHKHIYRIYNYDERKDTYLKLHYQFLMCVYIDRLYKKIKCFYYITYYSVDYKF